MSSQSATAVGLPWTAKVCAEMGQLIDHHLSLTPNGREALPSIGAQIKVQVRRLAKEASRASAASGRVVGRLALSPCGHSWVGWTGVPQCRGPRQAAAAGGCSGGVERLVWVRRRMRLEWCSANVPGLQHGPQRVPASCAFQTSVVSWSPAASTSPSPNLPPRPLVQRSSEAVSSSILYVSSRYSNLKVIPTKFL